MDIPDDDHVSRYIPFKKLIKDEDGNTRDSDGKLYGLLPYAFELRESDKNKLSVNWVEFFNGTTHYDRVKLTVEDFRQRRNIKKTAQCAFAVGVVSKIQQVYLDRGYKSAKIVHDNWDAFPSHSSIIRLPEDGLEVMQSLVDAFDDVYDNQKI